MKIQSDCKHNPGRWNLIFIQFCRITCLHKHEICIVCRRRWKQKDWMANISNNIFITTKKDRVPGSVSVPIWYYVKILKQVKIEIKNNNRTTGQQDSRTAGQQDNRTTGQQNNRTTGQQQKLTKVTNKISSGYY